ncbi:nut2 [Sarcoptes scabiei]|nr:nut2 [Sarcoptes scabiei]
MAARKMINQLRTSITEKDSHEDDDELDDCDQYDMEEKNTENLRNDTNPNGLGSKSNYLNKSRLYLNCEKLINDRSRKTTIILLVIILILGLILLLISIRVLIFSLKSEEKFCTTSSCLLASARFSQNINWSESITEQDRCVNFYEFACGQWINDHHLNDFEGQYSIQDQIYDETYKELKHYLDKIQYTSRPDDPYFKVKQFYESCMNLEEIDLSSVNYITHEIFDTGGWNILKNWQGPSWKFESALERIQTYYGVDAFFRVSVGTDDLDSQLPFIIKIFPSGLGLPRAYYFDYQYRNIVEAYKQYMSETVKIFGSTKLDASQFAENTFNYEKRIAEITPEMIDFSNPFNQFKRRFSIRELKILAPSIRWLNLLQKFFGHARLNDNTRVFLAFEHYFRNISNIISTTDNKGLNDYLIWKMISAYAPYLSKDFRIIHYNFQQALQSLPSMNAINDEDRWRFCLQETSKHLRYALSALYVQNKFNTIYNKTEMLKEKILLPIQRSIWENQQTFVWVQDDEDQRFVEMKAKELEVLIGHPQFILKSQLSGYYNEFFAGVKFLQNIIEAVRHRFKKLEMLLNEKSYDYAWPVEAFDLMISYDYAANKLFVPVGLLNVPFYDQSQPSAATFGAIGFHLASGMLKAFDLTGLFYNIPDGKLSNNRKFVENRELRRNLICLDQKLSSISTQLNNSISQTYIDIGALNLAWLAYKQHHNNDEGSRIPVLPFTNDQLFFISFAQVD